MSVLGPLLDPDSVQTPSDDTVVFKLKSPDADFPVLMMAQATFIIPNGSIGSIATSGIGTGPFKVDNFLPGSQTNLSAFSTYYRGQPALAGIQLISIADAQARTSALLADQVDLLWSQSLDFAAAREIGANPNLVVQNAASGDWHLIAMRTDVAPFTDNRVRQAMKLVVDDKEMIKVVLQGYGQPAGNNPVAPDDPYRLRNTWKPNISKAKALLKEAGQSGLQVTLYTSSSDGIMIPMSVTYKAMAAKAGIDVTVQPTSPDTYFSTILYHKSLGTDDWSARPTDQLLNELFRSGAKHNEFFWHNTQFDSLLNAARRELNFTRRRRLYQQAQQLVANDSGAIIPFFQNRLRGMNKRVQNIPAIVEDPDFFVVKLA